MARYEEKMKSPKRKARSKPKASWYRAEVWQGGALQAAVEGKNCGQVNKEIDHYAFVYGQDGDVEVKYAEIV